MQPAYHPYIFPPTLFNLPPTLYLYSASTSLPPYTYVRRLQLYNYMRRQLIPLLLTVRRRNIGAALGECSIMTKRSCKPFAGRCIGWQGGQPFARWAHPSFLLDHLLLSTEWTQRLWFLLCLLLPSGVTLVSMGESDESFHKNGMNLRQRLPLRAVLRCCTLRYLVI